MDVAEGRAKFGQGLRYAHSVYGCELMPTELKSHARGWGRIIITREMIAPRTGGHVPGTHELLFVMFG